jgi:hypothetical protein
MGSPRESKSRIWEILDRKVTIMVIPHTAWKPWRWQMRVGIVLFLFCLWSGLTFWAAFISSRHVDYWITKADNSVMLAKLSSLVQEMERARETLDIAKSTDRQMRMLLSLSRREDIVGAETGVGGPVPGDRLTLRRLLAIDPASLRQSDWRSQIEGLREE